MNNSIGFKQTKNKMVKEIIKEFGIPKTLVNKLSKKEYDKYKKPLGKVLSADLSVFLWKLEIKPNKGQERLLREIIKSPFLAGINVKIVKIK